MELQSVCLRLPAPKLKFSHQNLVFHQTVSASHSVFNNKSYRLINPSNFYSISSLKKRCVICASTSDSNTDLKLRDRRGPGVPVSKFNEAEPFRGKSGSVSFSGLTHQVVEERKLVSAPFDEEKGSFLWVLAPVALISSFILPQLLLGGVIEASFRNETLIEIVASLCFESSFYIGLAVFLSLTDKIQKPYIQFSSKRWGLITGLRGYLSSAFFTMGLKVIAPIVAVYVSWPVLKLQALVAVAPFLVGCAVQLLFENRLDKRNSSCWPLVPIIFELYRMYQLTRASQFIQTLMFLMKDSSGLKSAEKGTALLSMVGTFQFLALICLWSLVTFLIRLFPSRPVAENY